MTPPRNYYLKEPEDCCPETGCGTWGSVQVFSDGSATIKCANRECESRPSVHGSTEDEALKEWRAIKRD